jgi:DNA invertase Pin-like site-specific DNA recombinase
LLHNHESRHRQYGLADRARQLGWQEVIVIDEDLGRSGSGVSRPGFERLLAAICEGRAGAVFAIKASRLARNGRDWHTLIEFCGLVATIIVDEDGVYDPRHPNDRLLLGIKGTMSELELSILRQRSLEALRRLERSCSRRVSTSLPLKPAARDCSASRKILLTYRENASFFAVRQRLGVHHQTVQRSTRSLRNWVRSAKKSPFDCRLN